MLIWGGVLLLGGSAAAIYMGCDWQIEFLCNIRTQIEQMMQPGDGGGDTGGDTGEDEEDEDKGDSKKKKGKLSLNAAINWYANKIAQDLDDYNGGDLNNTTKLNIRGWLLQNRKSNLTTVAKSVGLDVSKKLDGKGKYEYTLSLTGAATKFDVNIPPKIKSELHAVLEGGHKAMRVSSTLYDSMTISVA